MVSEIFFQEIETLVICMFCFLQLVLLTALADPIPRPVLDYILKQPSIEKLFEL